MPIELYPSIAKIKRNGVYENLPGFVPETGSIATQQMIATSESSATAQYVHNKGEYFRLNDTLYQAIVKINVGDAIVVGTNCEVAVIGNDLTHVANSIAAYELGIATSSHNTGDYFMVNETMYVATEDIQVGDNISTSTNCRKAIVGDELSGLKTAITQLDDDVHDDFYLVDTTARVEWEQGRIQSENGQNANSVARIRTVGYFGNFNGVNSIGVANDAYFVVFAYSGDTYVGMWNPNSQMFGTSSYWVTEFDCHVNDNYKYRINVKKGSAGTDNITPTYGANIVFNENPEYVPAVEKSSPSKNIGFEWEDGNIDIDTGNDATGSGYRRSKYIPVEGGKTYAFNIAENENAYNEYVFFYDEHKTPILIDTDNNRYYLRAGMGWFPKMLEIPSDKGIAFVRWRWGNNNVDLYHGQAEENIISTSYRSSELIEIENEHMPNNIRGYIGKRILLLGDSVTAQNNWSKWFEASVKPEVLYNYAVGGATWLDPTSGIIYDGTSGTYNVLGNQVQRVLNSSLEHIDCIIILAGTNDTNYTVPTDEQIETAFFDNSMNVIDLADVDRTTWQGAMRWCLEKLILTYPSAKIFVCSPLQRVYKASDGQISLYSSVKAKGEIIEKMCKRMGVEFVDTEQCGISSCRSLYYADGLHPNQRASEKIARFIMAKYMAWFCQN